MMAPVPFTLFTTPTARLAGPMAELGIGALLALLLACYAPSLEALIPALLVALSASTLRQVKARVQAERGAIGLYRMLGGSGRKLAAGAGAQVLLLFLPAFLIVLLASSAMPLPAGALLSLLPLLAACALLAAVYAAWLACCIPASYGASAHRCVDGASQDAALLHRLYGNIAPAAASGATAVDTHWRAMRAALFLLAWTLLLKKHQQDDIAGDSALAIEALPADDQLAVDVAPPATATAAAKPEGHPAVPSPSPSTVFEPDLEVVARPAAWPQDAPPAVLSAVPDAENAHWTGTPGPAPARLSETGAPEMDAGAGHPPLPALAFPAPALPALELSAVVAVPNMALPPPVSSTAASSSAVVTMQALSPEQLAMAAMLPPAQLSHLVATPLANIDATAIHPLSTTPLTVLSTHGQLQMLDVATLQQLPLHTTPVILVGTA